MGQRPDFSLDDMPPEWQFRALRRFEKKETIEVSLQDGRTSSGQITTVEQTPPSDSPDKVYVQYLDYESDLRDDDRPHHAVVIEKSDDGEWSRAELTLAYSDTGRVRRRTAGKVSWIYSGRGHLFSKHLLSRSEAKLLRMKNVGIDDGEIADAVGCDEEDVESTLTRIRRKYRDAKRTVENVDELDFEIEPSRGYSTGIPGSD